MNMIIQNNLLPNSFLNGKLYVINDKKFRFKVLTKDSKAVVRTGEYSPYANIILKSGVVF